MKRRTALIITVILFALISVCFLRPAPNDGRVFRPSDRHELKLIGKDAHLLRAYMYDYYTDWSAMLHFQSADPDRYYTIGLAPWREGRQTFTPGDISGHINFRSLGTFYRLEDGEWVEFGEARGAEPGRMLLFTGIPDRLVTPEEGGTQFSSMPFDTPGRYRVMYTFYEYFLSDDYKGDNKYSMGSSGSERYEAGFEFTVPEASDEPVEPICVSTRRYVSENCTRIYVGYRINSGRAFYPQVDSIKFEKQSGSGYKNIESLGEYRDLSDEIYDDAYTADKEAFCVNAQYIRQCIVERIYEFEEYSDGEIPNTMCLDGVYGFALKEGTVYRLRVTFAEHEDGSGERYEASVKFRID